MKDRIKALRNSVKLTQTEFAERIGISRSALTKLEAGTSEPADRTVMLMAREFNANEEWLREGVGEMFFTMSAEDEVDAFCGDIKHMPPDDPRRVIMRMLAKLPESDWIAIADMIKMIREDVPPEE